MATACKACDGKGYLVVEYYGEPYDRHLIQRCDGCKQISTDEDAVEIVRILEPELLKLHNKPL
jgi:hypothetical protein